MYFKLVVIITSLFFIFACSDNETENENSVNFTTQIDTELGGIAVSSEVRTFSVSWSKKDGYSSALYLSTSSEAIRGRTPDSSQFVTLYEADINQSVALDCQVDVSYTVIECIQSGEVFGESEVIMSHLVSLNQGVTENGFKYSYLTLTVSQNNQTEPDPDADTYSVGTKSSVVMVFL